jgi:hypothetical protein
VLKAFLSAPGWAARSAYVLFPDKVREAMAAHAVAHRDGPIKSTGISLLQGGKLSHVYLVRTPAFPDGFPVAVVSTDDGWLVDWETFVEFHDDMFKSFADGFGGQHGAFHLLVNQADPKFAPEGMVLFKLNPPMPGRERIARVPEKSSAYARLNEIFKNQEKFDPETFRQLVASKGLPLVLSVSRKMEGDKAFLMIEDVLGVGWNPIPVQDR